LSNTIKIVTVKEPTRQIDSSDTNKDSVVKGMEQKYSNRLIVREGKVSEHAPSE